MRLVPHRSDAGVQQNDGGYSMKRHLIDSLTGEIIDIGALQRRQRRKRPHTKREQALDVKIACAAVVLVLVLIAM